MVELCANTRSPSASASNWSAFSAAIASVSPITIAIDFSTAHSPAGRPIAAMRWWMSLRKAMLSGLVPLEAKIISAQRAANSRPRGEEPACSSTGRTCGLRGMASGPRVLTQRPR